MPGPCSRCPAATLSTVNRGRRRWAVAAAVGAGAVAGAVAVTVGRAPAPNPTEPRPTKHVALEVIARIPARRAPVGVAATEEAVWVTAAGSLRLLEFDPDSEQETRRVDLGAVPAGVAVAGDAVWVGFAEGRDILRLEVDAPGGGGGPVLVGQTPQAVAVAEGGTGVWVAALNEPSVAFIDADSGDVTSRVDLEDRFPSAVAAGFDRVWVPDVVANVLLEIDPSGRRPPDEIRVGSSPTAVAAGEGAVWVGNFDSETVSRFDPGVGRVTGGVHLKGPIGGLAVGAGFVWATEQERGRVVAIDPDTAEVAGAVGVGRVPQGVSVGPDGTVWVAVQGDDELVRIAVR